MPVPDVRVRAMNAQPVRRDGAYVLYWMIAHRRRRSNFALERAVEWGEDLGKPVVVLDALRVGYRWASDRIHRFVIDGMAANRRAFHKSPITYFPYLEPTEGAGAGLLEALAEQAAVVVTDDFPCFFLPRMVTAAGNKLQVRLETVDANGLLPLRATEETFARAYSFRRYLQRELPAQLADIPASDPLSGARLPKPIPVPKSIFERWPAVTSDVLEQPDEFLATLPIDHTVRAAEFRGGSEAARATLLGFLDRLEDYEEKRNEPEARATSGLSPYLHFGHIGVHEVFAGIAERENWSPEQLAKKANGSRSGWWGMSSSTEGFLDELVTWRELGYNLTSRVDGYDQYDSLPEWARATLDKHSSDPRPYVYSLEAFEAAATHDPLWNAAQNQIRREGIMHNYLRMLWGKKILEWSRSPEEALAIMIELNNKYGLDGRNPNSYTGITWVLGRFDRPWGPERPIFGTIRYMSSDNTARKFRVKGYIERYADHPLFDDPIE